MRRKIAPTLQDFLGMHAPDNEAAPRLREARRELRALLAVARAAKRAGRWRVQLAPYGRDTAQGDLDALNRSLARLDRASATPRGDR